MTKTVYTVKGVKALFMRFACEPKYRDFPLSLLLVYWRARTRDLYARAYTYGINAYV